MNSKIAQSLVRQGMTIAGAALAKDLVAHGFTQDAATKLLGSAMVIVSIAWSWWTHRSSAPAIQPITPPPARAAISPPEADL